jgi:hypothetical protein
MPNPHWAPAIVAYNSAYPYICSDPASKKIVLPAPLIRMTMLIKSYPKWTVIT